MANSHLQNGVNANEINAANAATATTAPVVEQKEQQTVRPRAAAVRLRPRCGG